MMAGDRLFQTAFDLHRNGQLSEAEALYRQLLAREPGHSPCLHLLGLLCHQSKRHKLAVELISQALAAEPNNADYLNNLGAALRADGQVAQAITCYQKALRIAPQDPGVQNNLANAYLDSGAYAAAATGYRNLLRALPGHPEVRMALCQALSKHGFECHNNGLYSKAEVAYQEAITLQKRDGTLYYNLGNAQRELGKPEAAVKNYQRALQLLPNDADIHNNLGNVLRETGRLQAAIGAYQTALQINPRLFHARVHLVHQRQHACDWENLMQDIEIIRQWVAEEPAARISPFAFLAMPSTTAQEQRKCADNWINNQLARFVDAPPYIHDYQRSSEKLRIGYLSSDFRRHPLAYLITELIELHDRERFTIHAYSNAVDDKTPERQRLERAFDQFIDIRQLSTEQAAARIHQDQIDILVDLTGFTQTSRSAIVALQPAPVSINWLGFPGTMGAHDGKPLFDYILTDNFISPKQYTSDFAEVLLPLPICYQPNDRKRPVGPASARAEHGLPEQAFVFCCFNQSFKILPTMFDIWMRLLQARADSVLWLLESNTLAKKHLQREAARRGVDPQRLIFAPRVPIAEHLARHQHADLFLDTLPYNAHTTASDALWMGLPLLTCVGDSFAGRVAGSLLHALDMGELIAENLWDYERRALQLSDDRERLKALQQRLLLNRKTSQLFDTARFADDLEECYQTIWLRYSSGRELYSQSRGK